MVGDTAHISLVRCVDIDDHVYDLTKFVSEKTTKGEHGNEVVMGTIEYYYKERLANYNDDGLFDIVDEGKTINVREISPD